MTAFPMKVPVQVPSTTEVKSERYCNDSSVPHVLGNANCLVMCLKAWKLKVQNLWGIKAALYFINSVTSPCLGLAKPAWPVGSVKSKLRHISRWLVNKDPFICDVCPCRIWQVCWLHGEGSMSEGDWDEHHLFYDLLEKVYSKSERIKTRITRNLRSVFMPDTLKSIKFDCFPGLL